MPGFRPLAGAPPSIVVGVEECEQEWNGCARAVDGHIAGVVALPAPARFRKKHIPLMLWGIVVLVTSFYLLLVDDDPFQPRASDARNPRVASSAGK